MAWRLVINEPLRIDCPWPSVGAYRVASTIREYAVPIVQAVAQRLVPLATGALYRVEGELYLITAAHVFDAGARLGDMRVPVGADRLLPLDAIAERLACDADDDIAVMRLRTRAGRRALLAHWRAIGPPLLATGRADVYAICGYPAMQSRWLDGQLHSKPVTFYTRPLGAAPGAGLLSFSHVASRHDDADVQTPALEGVSGATVWGIEDAAGQDEKAPVPPVARPAASDGPCARLRPVGIQISYRHGEFVRCTAWRRVAALIDRLDPRVAREIHRRLAD